jgi:hypothetical protein
LSLAESAPYRIPTGSLARSTSACQNRSFSTWNAAVQSVAESRQDAFSCRLHDTATDESTNHTGRMNDQDLDHDAIALRIDIALGQIRIDEKIGSVGNEQGIVQASGSFGYLSLSMSLSAVGTFAVPSVSVRTSIVDVYSVQFFCSLVRVPTYISKFGLLT